MTAMSDMSSTPEPLIEHIVDCSGHTAVDMALDGPEAAAVARMQQETGERLDLAVKAAQERSDALTRLRVDALTNSLTRDFLIMLGAL